MTTGHGELPGPSQLTASPEPAQAGSSLPITSAS